MGEAKPVCDFCSSPKVERQFRAMSFVIQEPLFNKLLKAAFNSRGVSESDWAACRVCAKLIDAGEWNRVVDRAVTNNMKDFPARDRTNPALRETFRTSLTAFYEELRKAMLSHKSEPASEGRCCIDSGFIHTTFEEFAGKVYAADKTPDKSPSFERWKRSHEPSLRDTYQKILKSKGIPSS